MTVETAVRPAAAGGSLGARPTCDLPAMFESPFLERYYLHSSADRPPLRIGVLVDGDGLAAPFAAVVNQINRSNFARIELVVRNGLNAEETEQPALPAGRVRKLVALLRDPVRRKKLGFALYSRWDQARAGSATDLVSLCDAAPLFAGVEQITARPIVKGFVHRFTDDVVRAVRARDLDVLLRFGFNIIRGDMLRSARYGMWSYHHGDNDFYRGGPAHFWELYEGNPCSGVVLQVLNEELDNGLILDKAIACTVKDASHAKNRLRPYLLGAHMMIRALHDLHERGWDAVQARATRSAKYQGLRKIYRTPDNGDMVRFAARRATSAVARRLKHRRRTYHWRLAWRRADPAGQLPQATAGFSWIESPPGHFYADPFLCHRGGRTWMFFEDYLYAEQRGRLACAEIHADGTLGDVVPVLDRERHLSYPFVFEYRGETFMIPESERYGTVELYRAEEFPYRWVREKTLLPVGGVDTTVLAHDGRLWLFTTVFDPPGADSTLLLFHASDLFGDWQFHPANPISTDVRTARNAGAFLTSGGRHVRLAQDCSVRYGYAIHFQAITTLTPREYAETRVHSLLPDERSGVHGVHSYARGGGMEVIDGTVLRRI